ncbi:MAG: hypothetical protein ACM3QZ_05645 [Solirubrobacterales bacterium]
MMGQENRMDWSDMLTRNFTLVSGFSDRWWDMWSSSLGRAAWMGEQWETMAQMTIDRNKSMREEMIRSAEQMASEVRNSLGTMEQMVQDMSMNTAKNMSGTNLLNYWDLANQISGANGNSRKRAASEA